MHGRSRSELMDERARDTLAFFPRPKTPCWAGVLMAGVLMLAPTADALVLCTKGKSGTPKQGAPLKIRAACAGKEVQVDAAALGLRGPQGAPGEPGAPGAPGSPGAMGAPGLAGLEIVNELGNLVPGATVGTSAATASCPPDKSILGGGYAYSFPGGGAFTTFPRGVVTRPIATDPQGWSSSAEAVGSNDWRILTYALCASVAP
jgi:hypothetical protein